MIKIKRRFRTSKKNVWSLRLILFAIFFLLSLHGGFKLINYFLDNKITEDLIIDYLLGNNNFNLPKLLNIKNKNSLLNYSLGINEQYSETIDND